MTGYPSFRQYSSMLITQSWVPRNRVVYHCFEDMISVVRNMLGKLQNSSGFKQKMPVSKDSFPMFKLVCIAPGNQTWFAGRFLILIHDFHIQIGDVAMIFP